MLIMFMQRFLVFNISTLSLVSNDVPLDNLCYPSYVYVKTAENKQTNKQNNKINASNVEL